MHTYFFHNSNLNNLQTPKDTEMSFFGNKENHKFFHPAGVESASFFTNNTIQTKLTMGRPGDPYEREADQVADQVIKKISRADSAPATKIHGQNKPIVQTKCHQCRQQELLKKDNPGSAIPPNLMQKAIFESNEEIVQTKCNQCKKEQHLMPEIMTHSYASTGQITPSFQSQLGKSKAGGNKISKNTRSSMESAFGSDFSRVNIHTDSQAASLNKQLNAQAFTHGHDIYFDSGKYEPQSRAGQHLLAHELTHVLQQSLGQRPTSIQKQGCHIIPEVENQFYGHGAFMGVAPQLMANEKWNRILKALMPDVHADAQRIFGNSEMSHELVLMFENNPVMAAFGVYQTHRMDMRREGNRSDRIENMKAIEWDAFLRTSLVDKYKKADNPQDRDQIATELVDNIIIAHGTEFQTVLENKSRLHQYENVRKTSKSSQGGVLPVAWMDLFGKALDLATRSDWKNKAEEYENPDLHPRVLSPSDQARHLTFITQNQLSFKQVIDLYKQLFNKRTFSVLLDVKSRDATPLILWAIVKELNKRGVHVYGVGSFEHHEILGLSGMQQQIDDEIFEGPREVKFFHFAGDLQKACIKNKIRAGDTVMFNAGSLISYDRTARGWKKKASYQIKTDVVNQLRSYRQHYQFNLGVYVQENDIDDRAATMLIELTNNNREVFDLGFAWGGLSDRSVADIEPTLLDGTVGTAKQFIPGSHWDTSLPVPSTPRPVGSGFESTITIRHRFLESRKFSVDSSAVTVTCDADWNLNDCDPDTYFITLVKERRLWVDNELGSMGYPVGNSHSATWSDLSSGKYYLQIWFPTNTNPACILEGNITVSI